MKVPKFYFQAEKACKRYNSYIRKINKGLEMVFILKIPRKTIFFTEL